MNKSTVFRAIKAGKVSATRNEHDQWLIEPAELHRVYPPATQGNRKLKGDGNDTHQSELGEATRRAALGELALLSPLEQKSPEYQGGTPKSLHYRAGAAA